MELNLKGKTGGSGGIGHGLVVEFARINCIAPGAIETPAILGWAAALPGGVPTYEESLLPRRFGRPDEIAAPALFLASDDASFVNGALLPVDGAASARMAAIQAPPTTTSTETK